MGSRVSIWDVRRLIGRRVNGDSRKPALFPTPATISATVSPRSTIGPAFQGGVPELADRMQIRLRVTVAEVTLNRFRYAGAIVDLSTAGMAAGDPDLFGVQEKVSPGSRSVCSIG